MEDVFYFLGIAKKPIDWKFILASLCMFKSLENILLYFFYLQIGRCDADNSLNPKTLIK